MELDEYKKDTLEVSDIKKIMGCGINQAYELVNQAEKNKFFRVIRVGRKIKIPKDPFFKWYNGEQVAE